MLSIMDVHGNITVKYSISDQEILNGWFRKCYRLLKISLSTVGKKICMIQWKWRIFKKENELFSCIPEALYYTDVTFQNANRPVGRMREAHAYYSAKNKLNVFKTEMSVIISTCFMYTKLVTRKLAESFRIQPKRLKFYEPSPIKGTEKGLYHSTLIPRRLLYRSAVPWREGKNVFWRLIQCYGRRRTVTVARE